MYRLKHSDSLGKNMLEIVMNFLNMKEGSQMYLATIHNT